LDRPEGLYLAVFLPKFDVVTIDKAFSAFFRNFIVGADKLDCSQKPAVYPNDIGPISGHVWRPHRRPHAITRISSCLPGTRVSKMRPFGARPE
jgi:hypothetical protein